MIHFGTGGWRAVIGDDFTKANVQLLTFALARKMQDDGVTEKGFVIGYDRRFLSEEAAHWAAEVMAGQGIFCRVIKRESPTPLIMYAVAKLDLAYGMAVTASHNPAIYNGIKVFMAGGRDADEAATAIFERYIEELTGSEIDVLPYEKGLQDGQIQEIDPMNDYIDSILGMVDAEAIRARGLHIVLDPMYGVSKTALQTILLTTRCDVEVIHDRHDTLFGGRLPAPNMKTLSTLMNFVEEHHCDIGIATDGDADRLGIVDDKAEFLSPNKILVLLYYYLMKYKGWHGAAVRNLATTHLMDRIAADFGEICYEVPVGFKYISAKMLETGAIIGGESSGGLTVRGHIQGKDGIYAASLLVEMLAKTGRSLSDLWQEILDQYGNFEMAEHDLHFTAEQKQRIFTLLMQDKQLPNLPYEVKKVSYMDGCKVYFKNGGWVIVRFSGTEPLLRIFCEMSDMTSAEKVAKLFIDFLSVSHN